MIFVDANLLLYAYNESAEEHSRAKANRDECSGRGDDDGHDLREHLNIAIHGWLLQESECLSPTADNPPKLRRQPIWWQVRGSERSPPSPGASPTSGSRRGHHYLMGTESCPFTSDADVLSATDAAIVRPALNSLGLRSSPSSISACRAGDERSLGRRFDAPPR